MYKRQAEDITAIKERDAARALTQVQLEQMVDQRTAELELSLIHISEPTRPY